jgi:hypothetical protein
MVPPPSLTTLREQAERCLADPYLAALVLKVVMALDSPPVHPYRTATAREADVRAMVALERALDECQSRLRLATAENTALRAGGRQP